MTKVEKLRAEYNKNGTENLQYLYDELEGEISAMYPSQPTKPRLSPTHTPEEVMVYAEQLMAYESEIKEYKAKKEEYQQEKNSLSGEMMEIIKEDVGFNTTVPSHKQDRVWRYIVENADYSFYSISATADEILSTFYD